MVKFNRSKISALKTDLINNGHDWSFYSAVDMIEEITQGEAVGVAGRPKDEKIRFHIDPSLGFAPSDIKQITYDPKYDRYMMMVRFMGLAGSSSPLPSYYLEELVQSEDDENALLLPFFNFFSHRIVSLTYRSWKKYRYYKNFLPKAEDSFSQRMFSMIGIDQSLMKLEPNIQWSRLLAYSGMILSKRRTPDALAGVIRHAFDLEDVNILEYAYRKVFIPQDQKWSLGVQNTRLGINSVIGDKVPDRASKFIIQINNLTAKRFREFLPSGALFKPLRHLVEFMLTDQFAYDLELNIIKKETPAMRLNSSVETEKHPSMLGWTTFVGDNVETRLGRIQIRCRA